MKDRELTRPHAVWILIIAALLVPACTRASSNEENESRLAKVEPIEGSTVNRVTLTPAAAERLDIRTATVVETRVAGNRTRREVIPYAAVLYDPNGETWAYTNPEPLVFVRQRVSVDHIEGDVAVLSDGPPPGTAVVTVGAAELLGTEYAVGEE